MEILYRRGRAGVTEVLADLPDPPSYSAVRAMLRYLEQKGHVRHEQDGARYLYMPSVPKDEVRSSALASVLRNFFDNSVSSAVAALLDREPLSREEYERLAKLLDDARPEEERR